MAEELKAPALVLTGAGASIEFGAPTTKELSAAVFEKVLHDPLMAECGGAFALCAIRQRLAGYFDGGEDAVNFEHVYHCAQELVANTYKRASGTFDEYKPVLWPFVQARDDFEENGLRSLLRFMTRTILAQVSAASENPKSDLKPLGAFIEGLRREYVTRVYTTNYDDFVLQASPSLYTAFDKVHVVGPRGFDRQTFWAHEDCDSMFHLHGSVHFGFAPPEDGLSMCWFDDHAEAMEQRDVVVSEQQKMDGSGLERGAIVTGFDKLERLQETPLCHYYASFARDAMRADVIYVVGSGLVDLHLNTWLEQARRREPMPRLVFIDRCEGDFLEEAAFGSCREAAEAKYIRMAETLRMNVEGPDGADDRGDGWIVAREGRWAVWTNGFSEFLRAPRTHWEVVRELI